MMITGRSRSAATVANWPVALTVSTLVDMDHSDMDR